MKVGIIGSGGREHAICQSINKSSKINKIFCFPGNAGTELIAENVKIDLRDFQSIKNYILKNNIDLIKTLTLKTAIIERECTIRFLKLILDCPKYLVPLSEGIPILSFEIFDKAPEKLLHVAFSSVITFTTSFGRHVKFPNLTVSPVNVNVINLCKK